MKLKDPVNRYETISKVPAYAVYFTNLTGTTLAHPLDVMRVNMQANALRYMTLRKIAKIMFYKEGIRGFYLGFGGAFARCTVHTFSQYIIFHHLQKKFQFLETAAIAGISGFCSGLISTPFAKFVIIRQTDLTRSVYHRRNYNNFWKGAFCVFHKGGFRPLFAGFKLHTFTSCALAVATPPTYNTIHDVLIQLHTGNVIPWRTSLISLLLTGGLLSLIFTPVDAVKTIIMNADHEDFPTKRGVCASLIRRHGYKGFFLGLKPALAAIVPHSIIATITYTVLNNYADY
ncbi:mitochondrial dicarboxylate carrier-like [Scaptodrosophila lebanonensis]|uniref:Mitochondrial dicarboxylate carrier-like n=1 Tax=Drosophila lebanonensis TaxID=7225 RepID=A0A6J2SXP2_DROLE|nr:mitochondrial dicarboxylate carrier-like [Scaptodrosophila lebanonensis]